MQIVTRPYPNVTCVQAEQASVIGRSDTEAEVKIATVAGVAKIKVPSALVVTRDNCIYVAITDVQSVPIATLDSTMYARAVSGAELYQVLATSRTTPSAPTEPQPAPQPTLSEQDTAFADAVADIRIEGKYPPMPHQIQAARFKAEHPKAFDLSTMRTGKTGSTMLALEYLFRQGKIRTALILAPLSCVRPVWLDAIDATMPQHVAVAVTGTKAQRMRAFKSAHDIIVTNYESIRLHSTEYRAFKPDAIVIDECTHYANLQSARSKAIKQLIADVNPQYVWGLTGTPGHDPLKAFAMSKIINPSAVNCRTISAWRDLTQYRYGPEQWQWRNRDCAPSMIKQALSPAVLFKKDDLFSLPPVVYVAREAEPSAAQRRLMDELRTDMITVTDSGELITAQQKSVLVSKLLQCAAGAVYGPDGAVIRVDSGARVQEIIDLINEATAKTVIFSPFTAGIHQLYEALTKAGLKCAVVEGATSAEARGRIFHDFQYVPKGQGDVDVLIAHPRTTAFGIELAAADMMVFDGAPLSGDFVFGQAVERLSSVKQTAKQITIAQVYSSPEERKVFRALLSGQSMSAVVADLFKDVTGV